MEPTRLHVESGNALRGEVTVPGDKSMSHRAALFAALAEGESRVEGFLVAGVTRPLLAALRALGVPWQLDGTTLHVQGVGRRGLQPPETVLHCGHSATTMRLLSGALAGAGVTAVLDGSEGLRRRPMERIVQPLRRMGVDIRAREDRFAPLHLWPQGMRGTLHGGEHRLPVASAQVKSALLLAGLTAGVPVTVTEPGPSRDHSERLLRYMGAGITVTGRTVHLTPPDGALRPLVGRLPGDFSSAAFLLVAAVITPGSDVRLRAVGLNPTRTGLLDALQAMGADITCTPAADRFGEPVGDLHARFSPHLHGIRVHGDLVVRMIDEFPIFAVAAACAQGTTTVRQAAELRHKESDRIAALAGELRRLGVDIQEHPDGFTIHGGALHGGEVNAHGDHRLAMALSVAGLVARSPVHVHQAHLIAESFPTFGETLRALGAQIREENG